MAETSWTQLIQSAHKKNYRSIVLIQMTNLRRIGEPSLHNLRFQDFLKDDPRYLLFLMALNDHSLHGDIKANPKAELCWQMQTTKEVWNLIGRFYIVSAPLKITRFPPPKILPDSESDVSANDYWESLRLQTWGSISSQSRAVFTWPPPGETPKADQAAFNCQRLDSMLESKIKPDHPDKVLHENALDNFCLLAFKVNEATRFEYGNFPPRRVVYSFNEEENVWNCEETNP